MVSTVEPPAATIQEKKMRDLHTSMKALWGRFNKDEEGTALTEFVLVLPVFIVIFIGMGDMYKMQNASVSIQINATKRMWTEAIPVQKTATAKLIHATAQSGGYTVADALNKRAGMSTALKVIYGAKGLGMGLGGHFGESYYQTLPMHGRFKNDLPGGQVATRATNLLSNAHARVPRELVDDSPSGLAMVRPALAAGIRYGIVQGYAEESVETRLGGLRTSKYDTGFVVTVAPYPMDSLLEHGVTLATVIQVLRQQQFYTTVFGIKWFGNPYKPN
jgi:Flp pilus assembly pilin Flp